MLCVCIVMNVCKERTLCCLFVVNDREVWEYISMRKHFDTMHYDLVMVVVICLEAIEMLARSSVH